MKQGKEWLKKYQEYLLIVLGTVIQWILQNWSDKIMEMFNKILPYLPLYAVLLYIVWRQNKLRDNIQYKIGQISEIISKFTSSVISQDKKSLIEEIERVRRTLNDNDIK